MDRKKLINIILYLFGILIFAYTPHILVCLFPDAQFVWMVDNFLTRLVFKGIALVLFFFGFVVGSLGEFLMSLRDKFRG